jgi:ABC-2 type transport system permease protein
MAVMSFYGQMSYGLGSAGFLLGKVIRLIFFFTYIVAIFKHTNTLAGYTLAETVLFFLTFNIVDITAMVFFRGIYSARHVVEDGDLDYYLIQPCSSLFRMSASNLDFLDVATMLPVLWLFATTWPKLPGAIGLLAVVFYLLLIVNGIAIALAMHIFVAALAVWTQELENTIWIYRDMMFLGRFPVDIYAAPMRWALIVFIPIGVMTSFPAKALLGLLSARWIIYSVGLGTISMAASLWFWRQALKRYTSVSS